MNLYKELQEKLSEHNPTDVDELILDDLFENISQFTEENKRDLEKYSNLIHLSLNGFGLESLTNFPKLPTLQVLEIRQNKLTGKDFAKLNELYPELYKLKIGENPITSLDVFKVLANSNIKKIELADTPTSEVKDYRNTLFSTMKSLEIVDLKTIDGDEASSTIYEDDEGDFEEGEEGEDDEFDGEDEEVDEYDDEEGEGDDDGDDDDDDEEDQ
jgi:acidic leucine-rich nuclear phosphoprotein 32 family protein B